MLKFYLICLPCGKLLFKILILGIVTDETTVSAVIDAETTTEQVLSRRKRDSNDEFFNRGVILNFHQCYLHY